MVEVVKYDKTGKEIGKAGLDPAIFDVEINYEAVKEYLLLQLSNRRTAQAKVKTRAMVVGGGRKPWRQKGTGRARIGSLSSPILVGGGVAHGPTGLKNYTKKMPKKVRRMALRSILTDKVKGGALGVIEDIQMNAPKTKDALAIVNNIGGGRVLFIAADRGENTDNTLMDRRNRSARTALELSTRNLPNVKTLLYSNINPHDLMHYSRVVILESALPKIGEMLSNA